MYERPEIGMTVSQLTRKGHLKYGEVIETRTDGTYEHFVVEWSPDWKVEYPFSRWGDTVYVPTCTVCDSPSHNETAHD